MKKRASLFGSVLLVFTLVLLLVLTACGPAPATQPAPAAPAPAPSPAGQSPAPAAKPAAPASPAAPAAKPGALVLKAVSNFPPKTDTARFMGIFAERVTQRAKGELVINFLGGPEVIPMMNQAEAVRTGTVDVNLTSTGLNTSQVPEGDATYVSRASGEDEIKRGFIAYMDELYRAKLNLKFLGRGLNHSGFYLFTKKPVEKTADLAGRKVRSIAQGLAFIKALGAVPLTIETAEAYSALERGVADTILSDLPLFSQQKFYEVVSYGIDHPFYRPSVALVVNLGVWNKLPKNLQDIMIDVVTEFAKEMPAWAVEQEKKSRQISIDNKIKFVKFSDEEAKKYLTMAYESNWAETKKKISPESYEKLRKMLD